MYYQLYSQFKGSYLRSSGYMTRKYTLYTIENVLIAVLQKVVSTKNAVKWTLGWILCLRLNYQVSPIHSKVTE